MVSSFFCVVTFLVIYVDVLILVNILVNYFMLLAVKLISRNKTSRIRIVVAAMVGGVSSLLLFIENLGLIMTALKVFSAVLMSVIAFGAKPFKRLLKTTFWLLFICFIFGGLTFAIYIFTDTDIMIFSNGIVYFDVDITFLVVCSAIAYVVITIISKFIDKKAPASKEYYIKIQSERKTVSCQGLMDTGNNLREPFSNYPVVLVDKDMFCDLFDEDDKLRLIPVSTVSGETILRAHKPISLEIGEFKTNEVYIAESLAPLDEYKIILNINLEGEINNEKN